MRSLLYTKFGTTLSLTDEDIDIVFAPKELQMRKEAEKQAKDIVNFIGYWSNISGLDWTRVNTPAARRGMALEYTDEFQTSMVQAKAVPVDIDYTVTIWTKDLDLIRQCAELYLFWQFSNPNLILNYLDTYPLELDLTFGKVVDESPYHAFYEKGPYFVSSFPIHLCGWIFSSFTSKTVTSIILKLYVREGTAPNTVDTLISTQTITVDL